MVRQEMKYVGLDELLAFDVYSEMARDKAEYGNFDKDFSMLEDDDSVDVDYKDFLDDLNKAARAKSLEKRRKKDDDDDDDVCEHADADAEELNDPQYELFLKSLRAHEKSYVVESERNGLPFFIKYEGVESSDREVDVEYKRKLRSASQRSDGPSIKCKNESQSISSKETENSSCRILRNRVVKSGRVENVKISSEEIELDPDYGMFMKSLKVVDDHPVYEYQGATVVYESSDGKGSCKREEEDDESSDDDVEILDSATFYKMNKDSDVNLSCPAAQSEFRKQLISVLRKPFSKVEYNTLYLDLKLRKREERHIELRHGRERSYSKERYGKSYLDHYSGLKKKLFEVQDDQAKRLNLVRGFFFWLKNCSWKGAFHPWLDAECLAIMPGSG